MNKIFTVIIAGPTAAGKTEYAIKVAQALDGEIVSADSMQLYKFMDIGSAKPTPEEQRAVPHHLIDLIDPRQEFSVARYRELAREAVFDIHNRGKLPIVCGGTGLYINSIMYDMDFSGASKDEGFRQEMEELVAREGHEYLHLMLRSIDAEAAERIHPNNTKKIIRALEIARSTGSVPKEFEESFKPVGDMEFCLIGLTRERANLYDRINQRVDKLMEAGLAEEVGSLIGMGLKAEDISMKGIGYKELIGALNGLYSIDEAIDLIKKNTRHFAKRQLTWFRRYDDMNWFDLDQFATSDDAVSAILDCIEENDH